MKDMVFIAGCGILLVVVGCGSKETTGESDSKYFVRCASWDIKNEQLIVIDSNSPRVITMDPWPQLVFLAADGQHTVAGLISQLGTEYDGGTPEELPEQVREIVAELVAEGVVRLSDTPIELPYYLALPVSEQDAIKAKQLMIEDGFIKE